MKHLFWRLFAVLGGGGVLVALTVLWWTSRNYDVAETQYRDAANEQRRLENGNPYPNEVNVRKMKAHLDNYRIGLQKLRTDLATHIVKPAPLAPNEFQNRLRQAITLATNQARAQRVKLPEKFYLGFNEFVSSLPKTEDAPRLTQQLGQVQLVVNMILDARVDAISMFRRLPVEEAVNPASIPLHPSTAKPTSTPAVLNRSAVEFGISGTPAAIRKVINELASANEQFFIIRTLHVKNQKDKGPSRENLAPPSQTASSSASATANPSATPAAVLQFIVGNEHVDLAARVELVNFTR